MKHIFNSTAFILLVFIGFSCTKPNKGTLSSPNGTIKLNFYLTSQGQAAFKVYYNNKMILDESTLGVSLYEEPDLMEGFRITKTEYRNMDETWEMPWGEQRYVQNHFQEMKVLLTEKDNLKRTYAVVFRLFDDGLGFRYEFPQQPHMADLKIAEENTLLQLTEDYTCWWIPGDWDIYEHLFNKSRFTEIDALSKRDHPNLAQTYIPFNAVNTPFTMRSDNGTHLSFHEAALLNYSGLTYEIIPDKLQLRSILVGSERTPYKVSVATPFHTPWRSIQIADKAADLISSRLIVNLNEPNVLGDVSWVKPTKYIGIWWEMHLDKSTWDYSGTQDMSASQGARPHGKHGATTTNTKRYIDFAADNNIGAVLVEGWNTGWENWIGTDKREGIFDFVTPYPDYDLQEVVDHANSKGVRMIMHHETSSAITTYEQQMDTAYALMEHLGIDMVKTGYVGTILPKGEYHHGQFMVNHYHRVIQKAAEKGVMVNSHEPIMATGLRRTYPNDVSREGLRGQEFNAWASDGGNPPSHLPTIAFTRMLAGPIDYTPGIFNIKLKPYKKDNQVNTTLAQQLALYVVIYSPLQMAADLPEYYEGHPAFQFIRDVGVDWEQSLVLNGEVGEYVTIARQERTTGNWFVGSITNEQTRELTIKTDFLDPNTTYKVTLYADGNDAHWDKNPLSYTISHPIVSSDTEIKLNLASGGGAAISFIRETE
ncbi:MAG: glycoside hydrolase family 97 protein [Bacteroidales bacterium]|nr:glycoside hydrolase family 97 protein [Bacteroidales bacterium]